MCSRNRFIRCCYLVHIGLRYCSSARLIYFLYCLYSGRLVSFRQFKCPIHSTNFKIRGMLACVVENQYICFFRRMSSIEVRPWLTENEDVFTENPPLTKRMSIGVFQVGQLYIFSSAFFAVFVLWFIYC